jgi:AcrR family transcriptional regulator
MSIAQMRRTLHTGFQPLEVEVGEVEHADEPAPARPAGAAYLSRGPVIEAAIACFTEDGYEGVTVRAIAARIGCAAGILYRYFDDKRQLLRACAEHWLGPAADAAESGDIDARALLGDYVGRAREQPQLYRLAFWLGAADRQEADAPALPPVVERFVTGLGERLGDATEARDAWALVHGLLMTDTPDAAIVSAALSVCHGSHHAPPPAPRDPAPPDQATLVSATDAADDVTLL